MNLIHTMLIIWTGFAWVWWLLSYFLVCKPRTTASSKPRWYPLLTIFKPLPKITDELELESLQENLSSWVAQMDDNCEMLIGCHESDAHLWHSFCAAMEADYPGVKLELVSHATPLQGCANPKIAWMKKLIPHARGELWFWSDADIYAPPNTLAQLRFDGEHGNAHMVTCPYIISEASTASSILDTLFVNLEFYPGVLLLERNRAIEFGFGSGMLFSRTEFEQKVDLDYLAKSLADDYHLGRMLQPVKLATVTLSTQATARSWSAAVSHYRRWQKTVRWNRPLGFASQIMVLPLLGWITATVLQPQSAFAWLGILAVLLADVIAALTICRQLRCRLSAAATAAIPAWSFLRVLIFISCWLPIPVRWRGQIWHSAFYEGNRH
ncbi:ceramide glucosyltransferase [Alteromonadaceae bacterium 2753L.S.0a.02]|nr:ceramide glucosyltransferase [Alteromonadaceae bacterium 2753L.S.0a.02]